MYIEKLLADITRVLDSINIPYLLTGSLAYNEKAKFSRRKAMEFGGTLLYVITLEDLIISKLRWIQQLESELHKRDIETLLLNPDIDKEYVKNWCERLNLKTYNLI